MWLKGAPYNFHAIVFVCLFCCLFVVLFWGSCKGRGLKWGNWKKSGIEIHDVNRYRIKTKTKTKVQKLHILYENWEVENQVKSNNSIVLSVLKQVKEKNHNS